MTLMILIIFFFLDYLKIIDERHREFVAERIYQKDIMYSKFKRSTTWENNIMISLLNVCIMSYVAMLVSYIIIRSVQYANYSILYTIKCYTYIIYSESTMVYNINIK